MFFLLLEAYWNLIYFDIFLGRKSFHDLRTRLRELRVCATPASLLLADQLSKATDLACVYYWKQVLCLQRSASTVQMLRRHGIPARLVIGAQRLPFKAHAWVEVDERVINDRPYMRDIYAVLDHW